MKGTNRKFSVLTLCLLLSSAFVFYLGTSAFAADGKNLSTSLKYAVQHIWRVNLIKNNSSASGSIVPADSMVKVNTDNFVVSKNKSGNKIEWTSVSSSILWWGKNVISSSENSTVVAWWQNMVSAATSMIWWWVGNQIGVWSDNSVIIWWNSNSISWWTSSSVVGWYKNRIEWEYSVAAWRNNTVIWDYSVALWSWSGQTELTGSSLRTAHLPSSFKVPVEQVLVASEVEVFTHNFLSSEGSPPSRHL